MNSVLPFFLYSNAAFRTREFSACCGVRRFCPLFSGRPASVGPTTAASETKAPQKRMCSPCSPFCRNGCRFCSMEQEEPDTVVPRMQFGES